MAQAHVDAQRDDPADARADDLDAPAARWLRPFGAAMVVLPVWVAVIRFARAGFTPTLDVASTVLRSRDVLSAHPPLVGMWAAGSSWAGHETHFPGALQLYVLAVPVKVLGNTWGPLLAMAALNSVWLVLAAWLICRRLRTSEAMLGLAFLTLFVWSLGAGILVDPQPMTMVTIPFALFLIATWCVADGDLVALPVLAIVANYLLLDHLVLTLMVPAVGLCAPLGLIWWLRRSRTLDPSGHQGRRSLMRRQLLWSAGITLLMWLPSIVQELTTSPGNLTSLVESRSIDRSTVGSWTLSLHAVLAMLAKPPFWLRGSIERPPFMDFASRQPTFGAFEIVAGVGFIAVFSLFGRSAIRRRDHIAGSALVIAGVVTVCQVLNVRMAPNSFGFPVGYLRSLWGASMFVWFAIALNAVRMLGPGLRRRLSWPLAGATLLFGILATLTVSTSNLDIAAAPAARATNRALVAKLRGRGSFSVVVAPNLESQRYGAALLLALDTAGIPFCVTEVEARQYGHWRNCASPDDPTVRLLVGKDARPTEGTVLSNVSLLSTADRAELARLESRIVDGAAGARGVLRLSPPLRSRLAKLVPAVKLRSYEDELAAAVDDPSALLQSSWFRIVCRGFAVQADGELQEPILGLDLSGRELRRWAELAEANLTVRVLLVDRR